MTRCLHAPKSLSADEKALLRRWIEQGAKGLPERGTWCKQSPPWTDHWAFGPATSPVATGVRKPSSAFEPRSIGLFRGRSKTGD